jgi:hypothetical protein
LGGVIPEMGCGLPFARGVSMSDQIKAARTNPSATETGGAISRPADGIWPGMTRWRLKSVEGHANSSSVGNIVLDARGRAWSRAAVLARTPRPDLNAVL